MVDLAQRIKITNQFSKNGIKNALGDFNGQFGSKHINQNQ